MQLRNLSTHTQRAYLSAINVPALPRIPRKDEKESLPDTPLFAPPTIKAPNIFICWTMDCLLFVSDMRVIFLHPSHIGEKLVPFHLPRA